MSPQALSWIEDFYHALKRESFAWLNLIGQDIWDSTWSPSRTGWTDVGSPTVTGRYRRVGKKCEIQVQIVPGTTVASTAGTSYITLPMTAMGLAGGGVMMNGTTLVAIGVCVVDVTNSRIYVPTQAATGNTLLICGSFEA